MVLAIVSMSCITAMEITALVLGVNGAALAAVVAAVAGLGGYTIGQAKKETEK